MCGFGGRETRDFAGTEDSITEPNRITTMGRPSTASCFKIIACGSSDSVDRDDLQAPEVTIYLYTRSFVTSLSLNVSLTQFIFLSFYS